MVSDIPTKKNYPHPTHYLNQMHRDDSHPRWLWPHPFYMRFHSNEGRQSSGCRPLSPPWLELAWNAGYRAVARDENFLSFPILILSFMHMRFNAPKSILAKKFYFHIAPKKKYNNLIQIPVTKRFATWLNLRFKRGRLKIGIYLWEDSMLSENTRFFWK